MSEIIKINGYMIKDEQARQGLTNKADKTSVYTKSEVYTKNEVYAKNEVYTKGETSNLVDEKIVGKADKSNTYTKQETNAKISEEISKVQLQGSNVDLSSYAKKSEIPTKVSQLTNDSGFLTQHQDLSNYATKGEIPSRVSELTNDSGFIGEDDLINYATKEDLGKLPLSNNLFFIDEREKNSGFEGDDIFSISEGTVKLNNVNARYYRIPALTVTNKGTLVAFTDVRYDTADDNSGRISIFCRRSEDKGLSWGEPIEVSKYPTNTSGTQTSTRARTMDSTVLSSKNGKVFCLNGAWKSNPNNWSSYTSTPDPDWSLRLATSEDDGKTWTVRNINEDGTLKNKPSTLVSMLGGVGQGVEMYDGTLVFPVQMTKRESGTNRVCATVLYSKDNGSTWTMARGDARATSGENNIVEIEPNVLLMNARNGASRQTFVTYDLGETWSTYTPMDGKIGNGTVGCQGSSTKIKINGKELFLHSSPINRNNNYTRDNITLYSSYDWANLNQVTTYYPKAGNTQGAGYSCLAPAIIDGQYCLFALYERQGNIAFRNLGLFLKEIAEGSEKYFEQKDRSFEFKRDSLMDFFSRFNGHQDTILSMIEEYLNGSLGGGCDCDGEQGSGGGQNDLSHLDPYKKVHITGVSSSTIVDEGSGGASWVARNVTSPSKGIIEFNNVENAYIYTSNYNPSINFTIDFDVYIDGTTSTNWNFLTAIANPTDVPAFGLAINQTSTWNPAFDGVGSNTYENSGSFIGKWIHLSLIKSSTEGMKIYQDGQLVKTYSQAKASTSAYSRLVIGNNGALQKIFDGKIGDYKVFSKVLTENEITQCYQASRAYQA